MTGRLRCPDCDGPVQACARLGRIPVWAICTVCRREWLARIRDDGAVVLERHTAPDRPLDGRRSAPRAETRQLPVEHGSGR